MKIDLRKCPFCGSEAECATPGGAYEHKLFKDQVVRPLFWRSVNCSNSQCIASLISCSATRHSEEEADEECARKWNTRAPNTNE